MKASDYVKLTSKEKKKLVKSALRAANKDQEKLMKRYRLSIKHA